MPRWAYRTATLAGHSKDGEYLFGGGTGAHSLKVAKSGGGDKFPTLCTVEEAGDDNLAASGAGVRKRVQKVADDLGFIGPTAPPPAATGCFDCQQYIVDILLHGPH